VTNLEFGQNQYFYSIPRKILTYRFSVIWETNFPEQHFFFLPFLWPFLGEFTKLFVKNTKVMGMLQTIAFFYCKIGVSFDF
jgi:hypothetical protein